MTTPSQINPPRNSQRQRGAAILILVLILMLGLITLFTFRMDRRGPELEADRKTALALAQAKEALLGNSATNGISGGNQNPGRLPCPNIDNASPNEGTSATLSGFAPNAKCQDNLPGIPANMGRFPWKTLRVGDLRDGAAERLWYVVDTKFIDDGAAINSGTVSTISPFVPALMVNGNQVVAVIIAPGPSLAGQQRDTANQNNYNNYLESYGGPATINLNQVTPNYNDRMITITAKELFNVVTQRMVREFVKKLGENGLDSPYYPTSYPTMARRTITNTVNPPLPPDTWTDNQWDTVVSSSYSPSPLSNPTQFTLEFVNCSSVFTVIRNGTINAISRVGNC